MFASSSTNARALRRRSSWPWPNFFEPPHPACTDAIASLDTSADFLGAAGCDGIS
jgi:hypothetical protein